MVPVKSETERALELGEVGAEDDDAGLESDEDDLPEFVVGGGGDAGSSTAAGMGSSTGSHHRTLVREGAEGTAVDVGFISMKKEAVDDKPSLYELDLDQVSVLAFCGATHARACAQSLTVDARAS